jgi:hypothetical protein
VKRGSGGHFALTLIALACTMAVGFWTSQLLASTPASVAPTFPTGPLVTFTNIRTFPTIATSTAVTTGPVFTRPPIRTIATIATIATIVTVGPAACDDGADNDGDGKTDFPDDPGCTSAGDRSEIDPLPACADGTDNDGDGKIDLLDPGCSEAMDGNEADDPPPPRTETTRTITTPVTTVVTPTVTVPQPPVQPSDLETKPKATPPAPPPARPVEPPPPAYGLVKKTKMTKIREGLRATFVFKSAPKPGSRLKAVWFYNNKPVGDKSKPRKLQVASFARAKGGLPKGYWRCALRVRVPGKAWKTVKEARTRLR